jgi:multidrug efflux pump subunit AcrB
VQGPFFNDEFGDVYGSIYALSADGFSREELREHADRLRPPAAVPDVAKVELFGVQTRRSSSRSRRSAWPSWGWTSTR